MLRPQLLQLAQPFQEQIERKSELQSSFAGAERASQWQIALSLFEGFRAKAWPSFIAFSSTVLACSRASRWEASQTEKAKWH